MFKQLYNSQNPEKTQILSMDKSNYSIHTKEYYSALKGN